MKPIEYQINQSKRCQPTVRPTEDCNKGGLKMSMVVNRYINEHVGIVSTQNISTYLVPKAVSSSAVSQNREDTYLM